MDEITKNVIAQILVAKERERMANKERVELEQQLIDLFKFSKPEGSKTETFNEYKVTFTSKMNRTIDADKWLEIVNSVPVELRPVEVKTTLKVVDKGCRWLEDNEPEIYAICAKAITSKPAKVAVTITTGV